MKKLVMLAVCAGCVLQGQERSFIRSFPVMAAIDTDHDGVLSAAEIAAAAESLRHLDYNEDGKLSAEECTDNSEHGPTPGEMIKTLMAYDHNGDGKLQREELPERMRGLFDRGDTNHDGLLTVDEIRALARGGQQAAPPPEADPNAVFRKRMEAMIMRQVPFLAALDADHNGEISAAELQNAPAALKSLDRNGDGRLTDDEVRPDPLSTFVAQVFAQLDLNDDGRISQEELQSPRMAQFRAIIAASDRNHDGSITPEELSAEILQRADSNHDGVISPGELERALMPHGSATEDKKQEEVRKK